MIYVGIDIAAAKHACCILSEEKKVIKQFTFANSASGYSFAILQPGQLWVHDPHFQPSARKKEHSSNHSEKNKN